LIDKLYKLPSGWNWHKLGNIVKIVGGGTPSKDSKHYYDDGSILWASVRDMKNDFLEDTELKITEEALRDSSTNIISAENIVIATRVGLGKVCYLKYDTAINQDLKGLIPKENKTCSMFLFYWFKSISLHIESNGTGATVKGVKVDFIANLDIPLPALDKQKRIVEKLDGLFAKIDKAIALLDENIASASALLPSALNEVFSELSEKWSNTILDDIASIISGYAFKSNDFAKDNEIKVVKITNVGIQEFISSDSDDRLPSSFLKKYDGWKLYEKDIVLALTRPYINDGLKVAIVPKSYKDTLLNQRVAILRVRDTKSVQNFIFYFLCSTNTLNIVKELSKTLNQPNLSINDLKKFKIPLPPLEIQTQTVEYLDNLRQKTEKLKAVQSDRKASLVALKASILDKAFKGES
jgi:type I restriction enzyme, S subunit